MQTPDSSDVPDEAAAAARVVDAIRVARSEGGVLARTRRIGVACSGGPDSAALLAAVAHVVGADADGAVMHALHVDHGLQAVAAKMVAAARSQAIGLGIPCTVVRARLDGDDEAAAREARYRELAWLADAYDLDAVLTAHTADDVAGTLLVNLLRGTGLDGLRGIPRVRPIGPGGPPVVRPLLAVGRADTQAAARYWRLETVIDPANDDPRFVRTHLRRILGEFDALRPGVIDRICAAAGRLDADAALLDALAMDAASAIVREATPVWVAFDAERLAAQPEPLAARIVRRAVAPLLDGHLPPAAAVAAILAGSAGPVRGTRLELVHEAPDRRTAVPDLVVVSAPHRADGAVAVVVPEGSGWRHDLLVDGDRRPGADRTLRDELARVGCPRRLRAVARTVRDADGVVCGAVVPELALPVPPGVAGVDAVGWRALRAADPAAPAH